MRKLLFIVVLNVLGVHAQASKCNSLISLPESTSNLGGAVCRFIYKVRNEDGSEHVKNYTKIHENSCDICTSPHATMYTLGIAPLTEMIVEWIDTTQHIKAACEQEFQEQLAMACSDAVIVDGQRRIPISEYYK